MKIDYAIVSLDGVEYRLPLKGDITQYDALILYLDGPVMDRKGVAGETEFSYAIADADSLRVRRGRK